MRGPYRIRLREGWLSSLLRRLLEVVSPHDTRLLSPLSYGQLHIQTERGDGILGTGR